MQYDLWGNSPLKRCARCGQEKPRSAFHAKRGVRDGLQRVCRDCNIAQAKRFHEDNAEHCRQRISERAKRLREENQRRLVEYLLEHPCADCGETDPLVLEFDHLRDKVANVSALITRPWRVVRREIEKCEVVCANCHRRRTAKRLGSRRFRILEELERPEVLPPLDWE